MARRVAAPAAAPTVDALFGTGAVIVSSRAKSGSTSSNLLYYTDGVNAPWPGSVSAEIIVVNHGINDAIQGSTTTAYRDRLDALMTLSPATIALETPNPIRPIDLRPCAQAVREVAGAHQVKVAETFA